MKANAYRHFYDQPCVLTAGKYVVWHVQLKRCSFSNSNSIVIGL